MIIPNPKQTGKAICQAVGACHFEGVRKATVFLRKDFTVKAARRHRPHKNSRTIEVMLTVGRPNYAERQFIRACQKAGEPLPVRKVQLKQWPKKKKR
jgi:hypothetical protein